MAYPTGALGTDVSAASEGYIGAYQDEIDSVLGSEQINAATAARLRTLKASMDADLAILATVTNA